MVHQKGGRQCLDLSSSSVDLVAMFQWARQTAMGYVGDDSDPVGPWYEAALPGREAFCIRDVCHQCLGGELLGLERQNRNMLGRFIAAISEGRDYCSFWEIDRHDRPAPVDYSSDDDFWYVLNANFDIIVACYRLYQWSGDRSLVDDPAFDRFANLTFGEYLGRWQLEPDRIMDREPILNLKPSARRFRSARGIPSYDEQQEQLVVGSDLVAMIESAHRTYAEILGLRGETDRVGPLVATAERYARLLEDSWWDSGSQQYFAFRTTGNRFHQGGVAANEFMLWHSAIRHPGRILAALRAIGNTQVEVLSYLPMLHYRYGLGEEGYRLLGLLCSDLRRDYPEASYSAIEAIVCGLMGVDAAARTGTITTCPRLPGAGSWAEVSGIPTFAGPITVRHHSGRETSLSHRGDRPAIWRAQFEGDWPEVRVDGRPLAAVRLGDAVGHPHSYVEVPVGAGVEVNASVG